MLSEEAKSVLKQVLGDTACIVGMRAVQKAGPARLLDGLLSGRAKDHSLTLHVAANRKEAEQYIAGLLGMM